MPRVELRGRIPKERSYELESIEGQSLVKETTETFLLLVIAGLTLAGYVGLALFFVQAVS